MHRDGPLDLADWRRRVGELYADVRRIARSDPRRAWERWRAVRERLYREHPQSPVPEAARATFRGLCYDYEPRFRFELAVEAIGRAPDAPGRPTALLPVSAGEEVDSERIGWLTLPLPDGVGRLALHWLRGYSGGLFLPLRDATNGATTYAAGRYVLDTAKGADLGGDVALGTLVVDLNFAYHPSCAFDPRWACPLAPPENHLSMPVEAGERLR